MNTVNTTAQPALNAAATSLLEMMRKRREASGLAAQPTAAKPPAATATIPAPTPQLTINPCAACGCPVFWDDPYGARHCENCLKPPAPTIVRFRAMVVGPLGVV
jgi:hypothetical protein